MFNFFQNKGSNSNESRSVFVRHHENLLRAEINRISRIYSSEQLEQNEKISCSFSDFKERIKKISSAHKTKEHVAENFDAHNYYTKKPRKMSSKIFKIINDLVIFGRRAFFLERINSISFEGNFHKSAQQRFFFIMTFLYFSCYLSCSNFQLF